MAWKSRRVVFAQNLPARKGAFNAMASRHHVQGVSQFHVSSTYAEPKSTPVANWRVIRPGIGNGHCVPSQMHIVMATCDGVSKTLASADKIRIRASSELHNWKTL